MIKLKHGADVGDFQGKDTWEGRERERERERDRKRERERDLYLIDDLFMSIVVKVYYY